MSEFDTQPDQSTEEYTLPAVQPQQPMPPAPPPVEPNYNNGSIGRSWHYRLLWIIAALSLVFNILLVIGLFSARNTARQQVTEAADSLASIQFEAYDLPVVIDERLPISLTVPFSDTFVVPVSQTVPVSLSVLFSDNIEVPIQENIPINTIVNVPVTIPPLGQLVNLPIPIVTNIPIDLMVEVPISRTIPINTSIPVVFEVDVPVQSDVPINAEVPVMLDFPVTIPLNEMGIDGILLEIEQALRELAKSLGG